MATEHYGGDAFYRNIQFLGDEGAEAGGIEDAGHADDAVFREFGDHQGDLCHGVERVRYHYNDGVGGDGYGFFGGSAYDFVILQEKIVSAHARFAGEAGGDDYHVGIGGERVVV